MSAKPRKPKAEVFPPTIEADPESEVPASEVAPLVALKLYPGCPPSDPQYGSKTPAVVAWWFEYFPEEAAERYAGKTLP